MLIPAALPGPNFENYPNFYCDDYLSKVHHNIIIILKNRYTLSCANCTVEFDKCHTWVNYSYVVS